MTTINLEMAVGIEGKPVTADNTNVNLLEEIDTDLSEWVVADLPFMRKDGFRDGSTELQAVFHSGAGRAGLVVTGSGSSGATVWTDAASLEDAFRRYAEDDISN